MRNRAVRTDVQLLKNSVLDRVERLRAVWKAVEWTVSCDWGPDSVAEAVQELGQIRTITMTTDAGLTRMQGVFVPLQRHWIATVMDTPEDVLYLYERTGRKPDFTGFFDRGLSSIRLAGSVFFEELNAVGRPTGMWKLLLKNEMNDGFAHADDLAARLAVGDLSRNGTE
ncbi:hypothetical protein [Arthrobacter sp. 92]|uniref:hypothetical protein n=1 Tax=Arthrobacter sp. 92 TaxID=3418175 RepID=UPI003CFE6DA7